MMDEKPTYTLDDFNREVAWPAYHRIVAQLRASGELPPADAEPAAATGLLPDGDDLVARLRAADPHDGPAEADTLLAEAADEIERLRDALVEEMKASGKVACFGGSVSFP